MGVDRKTEEGLLFSNVLPAFLSLVLLQFLGTDLENLQLLDHGNYLYFLEKKCGKELAMKYTRWGKVGRMGVGWV